MLAKLVFELGSDATGRKKAYPDVASLLIITMRELLATKSRANIAKWNGDVAHYV